MNGEVPEWPLEAEDPTGRIKGVNQLLFGCDWPGGMQGWDKEVKEAYWGVYLAWGHTGAQLEILRREGTASILPDRVR